MMTIALFALLAALQTEPSSAPSCAPAAAFAGTICTPAAAGKHPAILLLGGSEGGDAMSRSAPVFAQAGYVAVSVAYFGAPGLPQSLQEIPVETVGNALATVEKRADVDPQRIAIMGISKGGELALLAASTYPEIRAVVADVPSPFAWEGIASSPGPTRSSSWTVGGKQVPYVPYAPAMGEVFGKAFSTHTPVDMRPAYDVSMQDRAAVDAAFFHLEKINGPVLFLSAGDDQIWDSAAQSQLGLAYLKKLHHPFDDRSQSYPVAGHLFIFATLEHPLVDNPFAGMTFVLGGTPQANVAAAADAWPRLLAFLESALRAR
jgi:dienelactone hydrolase